MWKIFPKPCRAYETIVSFAHYELQMALESASKRDANAVVKEEIIKPTVFALYNPAADTKISADASSFGLGAVLLQKEDQVWRAVAFAS